MAVFKKLLENIYNLKKNVLMAKTTKINTNKYLGEILV